MSDQIVASHPVDSLQKPIPISLLQAQVDDLVAQAAALRASDLPQALKLSQQAYDLAQSIVPPYQLGLADSLYELASANSMLGNMEQALAQALECVDLCQRLSLPLKQAQALARLGILHQQLGDYPTALRYHFAGLQLLEANGGRQSLARAHMFIGMTHSMSSNLTEARKWYETGLHIAQTDGNREIEALTLNNLAVDYRTLGDYTNALACGFKSLAISQEQGIVMNEAIALASIGEAYMVAEQYDKAMLYCANALKLLDRLNGGVYGPAAVETLLNIGRIYLCRNEPAEAASTLHLALDTAEQANFNQYAYMCHEALSATYEQMQELPLALTHYKKFHAIKESVINASSQRAMQQIEVLHNIRQAHAETEAEKNLREQDRQYFEQLTRIKNEFISTASHDLRNPVSNMLSHLYLLKRHGRLDDEKGQRYLRQLEHQTQQIRNLITNVFDLAKLETGRALEMHLVAVAPFLTDALESFRPTAEQKQLDLVFEISDTMLEATFDPVQIRRVIDNLLTNAIKYTLSGGRIGLLATRVNATAKPELLIQVTDTGLGIPVVDIPHIFDHFYRVHDERHLQVEGSGLGLSICKTIIDQHQGRIGVETHEGRGSCFFFALPMLPTDSGSRLLGE